MKAHSPSRVRDKLTMGIRSKEHQRRVFANPVDMIENRRK